MDKAYLTLFNGITDSLVLIQAALIKLQSVQLQAEEIVTSTPHPEDETDPTDE